VSVMLPFDPLPGADVPGSLAEAIQANLEALATQVSPPRIVRGQVSATGTVVHGTGYSVVRNAAGDYTITYTTPFADVPTTLPVAQNTGGFSAVVNTGRPNTAATFSVWIFDTATKVQTDSIFHFIAVLT
jgi:hypothetical protein